MTGLLAVGTNGFDNPSTDLYASRFSELENEEALQRAVEMIVNTWDRGYRPPLNVVLEQYRRELRRIEERDQPRSIEGNYPTFEQGVQIAWEAYCAEVRRQGKEPNRRVFEKWLPA
jgi:hypothetical protein